MCTMRNPLTAFADNLFHDADALYRFGAPQQSGPMTVLPVFGPADKGGARFAPPLGGLKLGGVKRSYGNVELHNASRTGAVIVPLHMGYIQDGAQNHALCRAALLAGGGSVLFDDAACVQQTQGGFLDSREQWFFVLPLQLREDALRLRGKVHYGKLWPAIAALCRRFGLPVRGHLDQVICRQRPFLNQYRSRLELLDGQTGALFYLGDRLVGIELAPDADCFAELWMPLVCFCYGTAAMELETRDGCSVDRLLADVQPFEATTLHELRERLADDRWDRQRRVREPLAGQPPQRFRMADEGRLLDLRLLTVASDQFAGQCVVDGGNANQVVYASICARAAWLNAARNSVIKSLAPPGTVAGRV
jgi:hypothetical protein